MHTPYQVKTVLKGKGLKEKQPGNSNFEFIIPQSSSSPRSFPSPRPSSSPRRRGSSAHVRSAPKARWIPACAGMTRG
ncbi:hypothetical protein AYM02_02770 [Coxiella burnetii]|uniref:Uncharacterized protein n=2 Tax=Coxiella burnetii TaxID=777 RepID=Q83AQ6_COXBU|nr:hypothetical protein [Coxiella burnetii]NP_820803.1 hypothetical protein CBU_1824 [Coxiella burnetii RSA 493]ACI23051.1 hypothetical protein CBUD_0053a [Coxiella burnetii Dugway 5J108-111]AAO91317.1 hypothetical protein CBU_1824 [Coxiella burnetii RSA 493]AML48281.1 hypothetical protein AUR58_03115 [Coxiella burnetii]AML54295.1 hypothetical protein AYM38_02740 [Coxiella burnetii]ARI66576.1 hypothetical protein B7L74_09380 [Coxiella burnetii]